MYSAHPVTTFKQLYRSSVATCGGVSYDASKTWASSPHGRHALPELNISLTGKFIFLVTSGKIQVSDKLI